MMRILMMMMMMMTTMSHLSLNEHLRLLDPTAMRLALLALLGQFL